MKTIFLTGASGFLGQALTERLKEDYKIYPMQSDLRDFDKVGEELKKVNPHFIIHLAARTEVEKSFYEQAEFSQINYVGTVNLVEKAKDLENLELFVFSSTMETYGAVPKELWGAFDENTPQYPNAPYAVAKLGCEYYLRYAYRAYGSRFVALRQTNTYGRHDNEFFVVEQIITQMLNNPKEVNLGYREPYRNFLYVDDLIDLYAIILKNVDLAKGEFFCTGPDNVIQIEKLAQLIADKLNWKGSVNWGTKPKRVGEIYYLNSTSKKAKEILGWEPKVSLDEGLDRTIKLWKGKYGKN